MSNPWLKFYPTDWRSDPALRMCSMAARGLWIEMIALMHEAVPYGHLLVSGRSPTDAQLAVLVGAPSDQIPELLGELDAAGVFSRTREGVIYSRKMTRTAKKAAIARKNGKNGGNPTLCINGENKPSDNQSGTNGDKPQKPEARSQIKEVTDVTSGARAALLTVLSAETADAFIDHRKAKRAKLTQRAAQLIAKDLTGHPTPDAVVETSIKNGWTGVFPEKIGGPNDQSPRPSRSTAQSDTLRQQLAFAGTARRPSRPDCF